MPGIFINYRREDSGGYAPQIYQALGRHFGKNLVFMDIDTIRSGEDYRAAIHQAIAQSDVFLAVIGRSWLHATDDQGNRRIVQPRDLVRAEIAQALSAGIHIVPVLVGHAPMPSAEALPDDLKPLAFRNAHDLPDHFFQQSLRELVRDIAPHIHAKLDPTRRLILRAAGLGLAVLAAGLLVRQAVHPGSTSSSSSDPSKRDPTAEDLKTGAMDVQIDESKKQPAVIRKKERKAQSMPADVPGPWTINRVDFSAAVNGPHREPRVVWVSRVSIGDLWDLIGFAPDRTVYLHDEESSTVCAIRDGHEQWAYEASGVYGITPGGIVCLQDRESYSMSQSFECFNSRGEGGSFRAPAKKPNDLLAKTKYPQTNPPTQCEGGALSFPSLHASAPVDGNCGGWGSVQDSRGRIYVATDRNTLFCFSPSATLLWSYKAEAEIRNAPVFSLGDAVFVVKDHLLCVREGTVRWSLPLKSCETSLVDKAGVAYVVHETGIMTKTIAAVDPDGKLLWQLSFSVLNVIEGLVAIDPQGQLYVKGSGRDWLMCLA